MNVFSACAPVCHACRRRKIGVCTADPELRKTADLSAAGVCPLGMFAAVLMGAPAEVPDGFSPSVEQQNLRRGGCCDRPRE